MNENQCCMKICVVIEIFHLKNLHQLDCHQGADIFQWKINNLIKIVTLKKNPGPRKLPRSSQAVVWLGAAGGRLSRPSWEQGNPRLPSWGRAVEGTGMPRPLSTGHPPPLAVRSLFSRPDQSRARAGEGVTGSAVHLPSSP